MKSQSIRSLQSAARYARSATSLLSALALLPLLFSVGGCSKNSQSHALEAQEDAAAQSPRELLQGHWLSDQGAMYAILEAEAPELLDSSHARMLRYVIQGMNFGEDGQFDFSVSMLEGQRALVGAYEVVDADDETLTVELTLRDEANGHMPVTTRQVSVSFLNPNQLRVSPPLTENKSKSDRLIETMVLTRSDAAAVQAALDGSVTDQVAEDSFRLDLAEEDAPGIRRAAAQELFGYWSGDLEATLALFPDGADTSIQSEPPFGFILTEHGDLFLRNAMPERSRVATYSIQRIEGRVFTLNMTISDRREPETVSIDITLLSSGVVSFAPTPTEHSTEEETRGATLIFRRTTKRGLREHLATFSK